MKTHEKVKQARSTMKDLRGQEISLGRVKVSLGVARRALSVVPGFKHPHPGIPGNLYKLMTIYTEPVTMCQNL